MPSGNRSATCLDTRLDTRHSPNWSDINVAPISVGVVAIGRNEGDRLKRCLRTLKAQFSARWQQTSMAQTSMALMPKDVLPIDLSMALPIVYVDSGSTDDSVAFARSLGIPVVELDLSIPFTGARARNAGFEALLATHAQLQYVQFIDGDCELIDGWLDQALTWMNDHEQCAVVCGRNHERFPEASIYNRLADMEWHTPIGETKACGGIALMRVQPFQTVGGFQDTLICGEEPELCIRLRQQGWKIDRIDADMSFHDSAMYRFGQWWKRSTRGGWAVAEGYALYGHTDERYMVKEYRSGWLWGMLMPAFALVLAWPTHALSFVLLLIYPVLSYRIYRYRRNNYGDTAAHARLYASFCTLSKLPQALGQLRYWLTRFRQQTPRLIEYKAPPA
jgi:glycosyltransferase involved in cell wall biosynthesis